MRGQKVLSANGIRAGIKRNIAKKNKTGCGYVLTVRSADKAVAEIILKENGIKISQPF